MCRFNVCRHKTAVAFAEKSGGHWVLSGLCNDSLRGRRWHGFVVGQQLGRYSAAALLQAGMILRKTVQRLRLLPGWWQQRGGPYKGDVQWVQRVRVVHDGGGRARPVRQWFKESIRAATHQLLHSFASLCSPLRHLISRDRGMPIQAHV